jgi:spore photoproduct lyase
MKKLTERKMGIREFLYFPRKEELLETSLLHYSMPELPLKVPAKWVKNSFVSLFYKSPMNIVCPHFWVFKPLIGCPYQCSYCFLQGTFFGDKSPRLKDLEEMAKNLEKFLSWATSVGLKTLLNVGELCDSLAVPNWTAKILKICVPILKKFPGNKLLFLTKAGINNIHPLLEDSSLNEFVIMSHSLNPQPVIERFEKGTASLEHRLEAAKILQEIGYEVRLRIDPIIPVDNWPILYSELLDAIFKRFNLKPERITLGSLRGLKKTLLYAKDKDWVEYLNKHEKTGWGLKIERKLRISLYSKIIQDLHKHGFNGHIALCKETPEIWMTLVSENILLNPGKFGIWENVKCNCKN